MDVIIINQIQNISQEYNKIYNTYRSYGLDLKKIIKCFSLFYGMYFIQNILFNN